VELRPVPVTTLGASTSDPCTNDTEYVVRIGEVITHPLDIRMPIGATLDFTVDVTPPRSVLRAPVFFFINAHACCSMCGTSRAWFCRRESRRLAIV
jgi:hypothetical protein